MLLLGKNDFAEIHCARFKGTTSEVFLDKKVLIGDLFTQIEDAMKFLLSNIYLHGEEDSDFFKREDTYEIPPLVFREALTNAVVHRDYGTMHATT